jgi:hypothetical protein
MTGFLTALDAMKAELEGEFPGWHIWFVPGINRTVTWCAQPYPLINSSSPEHLREEIRQAHEEASFDWPALAGIDDYSVSATGIKRPKPV